MGSSLKIAHQDFSLDRPLRWTWLYILILACICGMISAAFNVHWMRSMQKKDEEATLESSGRAARSLAGQSSIPSIRPWYEEQRVQTVPAFDTLSQDETEAAWIRDW